MIQTNKSPGVLTCLCVQHKQAGHVFGYNTIADVSKPARVLISRYNAEDFGARWGVVADTNSVLFWVKHRSVIVQVFYFNMHIGLGTLTSLKKQKYIFFN